MSDMIEPVNPADESLEMTERLGQALRAARHGEPLAAGDGELVVRYYEARHLAHHRHMRSEVQDAIEKERAIAQKRYHELTERLERTKRQYERLQAEVKELNRIVRKLVARVEMQFGAWHRPTMRAQLTQDPQIAETLKRQPWWGP